MSAAVSLARSDGGSLAVTIAGAAALLRASGAMWLPASRALVVADLHFEKGSAYAARGQMLPPYDTADTLKRLAREVQAHDPSVVVFLGDSFHDAGGELRMAPCDVAFLTELAAGRRLVWVVGNHDADGPRTLPGEVVEDIRVESLRLRHEPEPGAERGEAAGHLHPCARVAATGGAIRRRCFVTDGARVVLPAFGAVAGGLNLRDAAFAALFPPPPLAVVLGREQAQPIAWERLVAD